MQFVPNALNAKVKKYNEVWVTSRSNNDSLKSGSNNDFPKDEGIVANWA